MDGLAVIPGCVTRGRKNPLHYGLPARLRLARGEWAITSLSRAAGLAVETASNIEISGAVPRLDVVERLARAMLISPGWLAYGPDGSRPWQEKTQRAEQEDKGPLAGPGLAEGPLACEGVGARLRQARGTRSVRSVAREAEVSDTTVRLTEEGGTIPTIATTEGIARALGLAPSWLAYGEG